MTGAIRWDDLAVHAAAPGITGSWRSGDQLSAALFRLGPGAVVPRHHHPNEEFGQVLSGSLELHVGEDVDVIQVGSGFLIPADLVHFAVAGRSGCVLLECYAPPRDPFASGRSGDDANAR